MNFECKNTSRVLELVYQVDVSIFDCILNFRILGNLVQFCLTRFYIPWACNRNTDNPPQYVIIEFSYLQEVKNAKKKSFSQQVPITVCPSMISYKRICIKIHSCIERSSRSPTIGSDVLISMMKTILMMMMIILMMECGTYIVGILLIQKKTSQQQLVRWEKQVASCIGKSR